MSYTVLARKYRPQDFEELVGQIPVSKTLVNALESGRVAHAYVFSGPRGVGKTTTARILAKCLNCEKGTSIKPCNQCSSCQEIGQGTSMQDVLEIDGASNRGIEQIRELRENAKYAPTKSRYRIFIIDEAHQITKDAFGALLKTLEEPPDHVIFMMATTEVQKIPAPILSRCQRFSLRPISPDIVFQHLKKICAQEKVQTDDSALADIVKFTEGSLRDALSLLDQALVFSPEGITSQTLRELLGLLPEQLIRNFSEVIQKGDPVTVLKSINTLLQEGIDFTQLGKDLQNYYHTLLLAKAGVEDPLVLDRTTHQQTAAQYDFQTLERHIRLLSRALDEMRYSDTPRAVFEIYALQLAQKTLDPRTLVERLEKLEKSRPSVPASQTIAAVIPLVAPPPAFNVPAAQTETKVANEKEISKPLSSPSVKQSTQEWNSDRQEAVRSGWEDFVNEVAQTKQGLAAALDGVGLQVTENGIFLTFSKSFNQQMVARSLDMLKSLLQTKFGIVPAIETKVGILDPSLSSPASPQKPPPPSSVQVSQPEPKEQTAFEELSPQEVGADVQKALKHFPGILKREKKVS